MNQGIPKSARDALARQRPADEHPSADLLNGYVEQSLNAGEKEQVVNHLAACADCREVVFLASTAVEQPALVAAAAMVARPEPPRSKMWWKWAIPAVAVAVIVGGVVIRADRERPASTQMAENKPAAPAAEMAESRAAPESASPTPPPSALEAKPGPVAARPKATVNADKKTAHSQTVGQVPMVAVVPSTERDGLVASEAKIAGTPVASGVVSQTTAVAAAPADIPAKPTESARVQHAAPVLGPSPLAKRATSAGGVGGVVGGTLGGRSELAATVRRSPPSASHWRITSDGHLEHSLVPDTWSPVLADQSVSFRVVSVVGNDVWAGGSNGALFHSVDGGEHWARVALGAAGNSEKAGIVSIRFDTALEGSVSLDSGESWSTSDGGQSWSRQ